jgi:hypothetical protein
MRAEPPDHLTERVWQVLADARSSSMSRTEVMERLTLSLRRNLTYLARKKQQTPYVEALEGDLEAMARAIALWKRCLRRALPETGGTRRQDVAPLELVRNKNAKNALLAGGQMQQG